ncbi:MAG: response regulator [Burkholderiales bacterium]|nr:response regulator [Burkholderiales bacterium]
MLTVAPAIRQRHRQQWLALGLGLLVLCATLGGWLRQQREAVLSEQGLRLRVQAHGAERNLARQLRATHLALGHLADEMAEIARWQQHGGLDPAESWLHAMSEVDLGVHTVSVLDAQARIVASNRPELVGRTFPTPDAFENARRGGDPAQLYLSPPGPGAGGHQVLNTLRVVRDAEGRFAGAVAATLDTGYFGLLLSTVNFAPDMWSAIAHESGALLAMSPAHPELEGKPFALLAPLLARHLAAGAGQTLFRGAAPDDGGSRLVAQQTVRPLDLPVDHPLVVAVSRSEDAVLAGWRRLAGEAAALATLLLAVTLGGLRWMQRAERAAAGELAESLDRLARVGQTAPGVICQLERHPDGRVALPYATRSLEPLLGISVSEAPGSADALFGHIHPDDRRRLRRAIDDSARALSPLRAEFRMQLPGQPERWLELHSLPQRRPGGSTLWTGLVTETTEQHAARQAQLALAAAQQANRAKSEFLSRASHELRTPLNAVIGFASLMLSHPRDRLTPTQREQLGYIADAGRHLLALINDMLDVSAIESGRVSVAIGDVDARALLAEVLSTLREQAAAAGVALAAGRAGPATLVRADPVRLKQVLLNLLSNAIKYNRAGGHVTATVGAADAPPGLLAIEVRDTGSGLTPEQREHLFEPFNRLGADHRGIPGTGIGLTISKMLVELMQGRIEVESWPGQGTRFVIHLPAVAMTAATAVTAGAPASAAAAPPLAVPARVLPPLRVLYVEDHPINALFVRELLALRPDVQLQVAPSGHAALQALQDLRDRHAPAPELLLVDLHLGDMSGFELLERLRADPASAALRCVALTADALPATRQQATEAGFVDYLTKPIDLHHLLAIVDREALARAG